MPSWILPSLIVSVLFVLVMPVWPHSKGWTWAPAGMVGMIGGIIISVTLVSRLA